MFLSILRQFLYTTSERLHGLEILKRSKLKNNKLCGTLFDENVAVFCFKNTSVGLQMSGKMSKLSCSYATHVYVLKDFGVKYARQRSTRSELKIQ